MRIEIIRDRCEGHGLCEGQSPSLYSLDDEGYVVFEYAGSDVPAEFEATAAAGAMACPVAALIVHPSAGHKVEARPTRR
jgi:ferredoxin